MTPHADLVARLEELASKNGCLSAAYENCIEQGASQSDMCLTCAAATAAKALAALPPPADQSDRNTAAEHYRQGWQAGHAAADPPALVALDCAHCGLIGKVPICQRCGRERSSGILPLPAAPPVTDTPRGISMTIRGHENIAQVVEALRAAGYQVAAAPPQEDQ